MRAKKRKNIYERIQFGIENLNLRKKNVLIIRIFSFSKCDAVKSFAYYMSRILTRDMITMLQVLCHIFHDAWTN